MLAKKKKKLKKKQIQEDKLITTFYQIQDFYEKYQKQIFFGVGIIAVIVVAFLYYTNKMKDDNVIATTEMSRIIPIYDSGNYQEAITGKPGTKIVGLKYIVENYGSTEQGEVAKIYLANSYYFLGKYDKAYKIYKDYSGSIKMFEAAALAGIGNCLEIKKDYLEAANHFKDAAFVVKANPLNASYLLQAGIDYLKANRKDEAKLYFKMIKDNYKNSQAARKVNRYLAIMGDV